MALANMKGWKDLWRDVYKIDSDKNGMMELHEME